MQILKNKILFVDDDPDDLEFYGEGMRAADPEMSIDEVRSGIQALDYLDRARRSNSLPCLIVLDVNMPLMSGKETLQQIKKDKDLADIPVVIFSTASNPKEKESFEDYEVAFFTKPSSFFEMQVVAKQLLGFASRRMEA
jgi:CheY-like chemotaxis protein